MLRLDFNLVFTIINLLILYVAVRHFLLKPIDKIIAERQKLADAAFEEAKAREDSADQKKAEYQASLAGVGEERDKILAAARSDAAKEYQQIMDSAKAEAEKTIQDARAAAERDKQKMYQESENEIADMIINASSKILAAKVPEESEKNLYDKFIDKAGEEN